MNTVKGGSFIYSRAAVLPHAVLIFLEYAGQMQNYT